MRDWKDKIGIALRGAGMGIAEVIPGVSGGTIAFITGIYERLILAIRAFGPGLPAAWKHGGLRGVWSHIDAAFLIPLFLGMALGLVAGLFAVTALMESHPPVLWAFFFGLIAASVVYIGNIVGRWRGIHILFFLVAAGFAYWITQIVPVSGSTATYYVFFCGMIAICALILPGISGSFILLLLGMYTVIIPTLKELLIWKLDDLLIIGVFGLGCLAGLALFSRLLAWTFNKFYKATMVILSGFMLGSLPKIWPWRNPNLTTHDEKGELVVLTETLVLPQNYHVDPHVLLSLIALGVGVVLVILMSRANLDKRELKSAVPVEDH